MLSSAAELKLVRSQWLRLNQLWVGFFIFLGAVNLFVYQTFGEKIWVMFKLFGMLGLTIVFVIIQSIWLTVAAEKSGSASGDVES